MKKESGSSKLKIILTALGTALLVSLASGLIFFLSFLQPNKDVSFQIEIQEEKVMRGEPFKISANIENETSNPLKNVNLSLDLSEGLRFIGVKENEEIINKTLNNIGGNNLTKENFRILPVAKKDSKENIEAVLSYSFGSAEFEKSISEEVGIPKEAIKLGFERPEEIITGSSFESKLKYENKSNFQFPKVQIEANTPDGFKIIESDKKSLGDGKTWPIGLIKEGEEGQINIRGRVEDENVEPLKFKALAEFLGKNYEIANESSSVKPSKSPIKFDIKSEGTPRLGEEMKFTLNFKNKSGTALRDIKINSFFRGELFDKDSLETTGKANLGSNSISWSPKNTEELEILEPSSEGEVSFRINLKEDFSMRQLSDKNFTLELEGQITSDTVPHYLDTEQTSAKDSLEIKVGGETSLSVEGLYRDPQSKIINEGPMPPEVGKTTQFTVHWAVSNKLTDLEEVKIRTTLPKGVEWTNRAKSNGESVPIFKPDSRKVVWKIDKVPAGKGEINPPLESIFQIEITPSDQRKGEKMELIKKTVLEAKEPFTGNKRRIVRPPINTSLPDDGTVSPKDGIIKSAQ